MWCVHVVGVVCACSGCGLCMRWVWFVHLVGVVCACGGCGDACGGCGDACGLLMSIMWVI